MLSNQVYIYGGTVITSHNNFFLSISQTFYSPKKSIVDSILFDKARGHHKTRKNAHDSPLSEQRVYLIRNKNSIFFIKRGANQSVG